ncbi:MAG TPA: hypothetical protein VHP63_02790, partial [candidate division Zixibacteria bacterium]|nr:hypothetical protein [candidate division Zixibacteria bacterium]
MNITTFVYLVLILLQCGTLAAKSSEDLCIELIGSNKSEGYWDDQLILNIGNNVATDTLNSIEVRVYAIGKLIDSIKIDTLFPMQSTVIQFHFTKTPHHGIVRVSFIKNQKISQLAIPFSKSSSLDFFLSRNVFISPLIAIFGVLLGAFLNHFLNLRKETHQATLQKQKVIFEKTEPILRDFLINISNERTATMLEKYYMSLK